MPKYYIFNKINTFPQLLLIRVVSISYCQLGSYQLVSKRAYVGPVNTSKHYGIVHMGEYCMVGST